MSHPILAQSQQLVEGGAVAFVKAAHQIRRDLRHFQTRHIAHNVRLPPYGIRGSELEEKERSVSWRRSLPQAPKAKRRPDAVMRAMDYARILVATLPATSVNRKSRPA